MTEMYWLNIDLQK